MNHDYNVRRRLAALTLATAGFCLSLAARAADIPLTPEQERSLGIVTVHPVPQSGTEVAGLAAQVVIPNNQLRVVSAPVAGLLESLAVAVGDPVRKGQALARLRSPTLAEGQSGLVQAAIQARLARETLDRDEQLWREGIISQSRYQAARSRAAETAAVLQEKRQALQLAGVSGPSIDRLAAGQAGDSALSLVAPIDGVVLEQMAAVGERLEAAAPVYRLARLDPLWLDIHVPLARVGGVAEGARVTVPAQGAGGKVITVGRSVDPASQTVSLRALITDNASALRPGQVVEAAIHVAGGPVKQWGVPVAGVVRRGGEALVFVRGAGAYRAVPVAVVAEGREVTVVTGPLREADDVAVQGVASLKAKLAEAGEQ